MKKFQIPKRTFENAGYVNPEECYFVPFQDVTNSKKQDIFTMIDLGRYFSIFAPRQSGKTTFFTETRRQLHKEPTYVAIVLSFQQYRDLNKIEFYQQIERSLYKQLLLRLKEVGCEKLKMIRKFLDSHHLVNHISFYRLFEELNQVIKSKKIVIFIDEFDGVPVSELGNFLTSLRDLYQDYKSAENKALYSVGLVGIRNVTKLIVGGVSPFNIADQVSLSPFSEDDVRSLYAQYTEETKQPFTAGAVRKVYEETAGQPWLVNRLGTILTVDVKPRTLDPIDENDVQQAISILLKENNDHFDNLYEKAVTYKESFIEIVFDHREYVPNERDQSLLEQHGLIKEKDGKAVITNNIYKSRFTKTFFKEVEDYRDVPLHAYFLPDGKRIDMPKVFLDFTHYINQVGINSFYQEDKPYEKTGKFLLTAWLYQFVGIAPGSSELRHELPTGLGRVDILLTCKGIKYIIETKVNRYKDINRTVEEGLNQLSGKYLATEAGAGGFLVIFDTRSPVGSESKTQVQHVSGREIYIFIISIGRPASSSISYSPSLNEVLTKGVEGGNNFERLMKKLLIYDGSLKGYEFEPGAEQDNKGIPGRVSRNYPGVECPVVFQFIFLEGPLHQGPAAQQVKDSFRKLIESGEKFKSYILVTPKDSTDAEKKWLKELPAKFGSDCEMYHYGQTKIEVLLDQYPAVKKVY